jgi:hypothetical protein
MMGMKSLIGFVEFVIKKYSRHSLLFRDEQQITNYERLMAET